MLGQIIDGRYELIRKIGEGGMGAVYAARHTTLEKLAALKLLGSEWRTEITARAQMVNEAKAAARIRHDNVVNVVHVGETREGDVYIVMELLEGSNLEVLLEEEGPLDLVRAQALLLQISAGLAAAHGKRVVHRDIKPANCFVETIENEDGERVERVKIVDFGISKIIEGSNDTAQVAKSTRPWGTRLYIAPEVQHGESSRPASDVFSFGVLAYRMLTGRFPYKGGTITPFEDYRSDIPYYLRDLVLSMLQQEAASRPQSMAEVHDALKSERRRRIATNVPTGNNTDSTVAGGSVSSVTAPNTEQLLTGPVDGGRGRAAWIARWTGLVVLIAAMLLIYHFAVRRNRIVELANGDGRHSIIPVARIPTPPSEPDRIVVSDDLEPRESTEHTAILDVGSNDEDTVEEPEVTPPKAGRRGRRSKKESRVPSRGKKPAPPEEPEPSVASPAKSWTIAKYQARFDDRDVSARGELESLIASVMKPCLMRPQIVNRRLRVEFVVSPKLKLTQAEVDGPEEISSCVTARLSSARAGALPEAKYAVMLTVHKQN